MASRKQLIFSGPMVGANGFAIVTYPGIGSVPLAPWMLRNLAPIIPMLVFRFLFVLLTGTILLSRANIDITASALLTITKRLLIYQRNPANTIWHLTLPIGTMHLRLRRKMWSKPSNGSLNA